MRTNLSLSHNAILYMSLGFTQQSLLQVLQLRKGTQNTLEMIVYDGIVYAGARFDYSPLLKKQYPQIAAEKKSQAQVRGEDSNDWDAKMPHHLDVIQVEAVLHGKNQPLWINHLEIIQTGISQILGREIITLQELMKRRRFLPVVEVEDNEKDEESSKPSKHIKSNEEVNCQLQESSSALQLSPDKCHRLQQAHLPNQHYKHTDLALGNQILIQQQMNIQTENTLARQEFGNASVGQQLVRENQEKSGGSLFQQPANEPAMQSKEMPPNPKTSRSQENMSFVNPEQHKEQQQLDSQTTKPQIMNRARLPQVVQLLMSEEDDEVQIVETQKRSKLSTLVHLMNQRNAHIESKLSKSVAIKEEKSTNNLRADERILIKDLYERMHRFKLVCRINHIEQFISQKGNERLKMVLVDEVGDQIFCLLLEKALGKKYDIEELQYNRKLNKGRTYIFENGEVEKDQMGSLTLLMPWSGIQQTKLLMESFNPTKMFRVGQIETLPSYFFAEKTVNSNSNSINNRRSVGKQINVCGIFMGMSEQAKLINNQFKVTGKLCDFQQEKSIAFSLFLSELTTFPREAGVVMSLHNMKVVQSQGVFRLQSGKRSYYLVQNHCEHKYMADLIQLSRNHRWKEIQYKNLSEVVYVSRKIKQLTELLVNQLEGQNCFSEIDCNVVNIRQTKDFAACVSCKKQVRQNNGLAAYCYNCKKIEKWVNRYYFTAEVADSTGSIDLKFTSDDIQGFLNISAEEYSKLLPIRRQQLLELSTYLNVLVRLKSDKIVGGSVHYVNRVHRATHSRPLQQIKERSVEEKLKYKTVW